MTGRHVGGKRGVGVEKALEGKVAKQPNKYSRFQQCLYHKETPGSSLSCPRPHYCRYLSMATQFGGAASIGGAQPPPPPSQPPNKAAPATLDGAVINLGLIREQGKD